VRVFRVRRDSLTLMHAARVATGVADVAGVAFTSDGTRLVAGTGSGVLWLFAVSHDGLRFLSTERPPDARQGLHDLVSEPVTPTLAYLDGDEVVFVAVSGRKLTVIGKPAVVSSAFGVNAIALAPRGKLLAISTKSQTQLFAVTNGKLTPRGAVPSGAVYGLAFSPNGSTLAVGSYGSTALYDVSAGQLARQVVMPAPHEFVGSFAFAPDGSTLVTANSAYELQVLGIVWSNYAELRNEVCGLVWRNLSPAEWSVLGPPGLADPSACGND
jgi:WD40 repeat protein